MGSMLHHCNLWGRSFVPYGPSSRPSLPIPGCPSGFYRLVRTLKKQFFYDLWRGIRFSTRHFYSTPRPGQRTESAGWAAGPFGENYSRYRPGCPTTVVVWLPQKR